MVGLLVKIKVEKKYIKSSSILILIPNYRLIKYAACVSEPSVRRNGNNWRNFIHFIIIEHSSTMNVFQLIIICFCECSMISNKQWKMSNVHDTVIDWCSWLNIEYCTVKIYEIINGDKSKYKLLFLLFFFLYFHMQASKCGAWSIFSFENVLKTH